MRVSITLLLIVSLCGCGTVEVFNATYAVSRNRIGAYQVEAVVVPTSSSVTVLDVYAIVDERLSPRFPLTPEGSTANLYRGPVLTRTCPEVINLTYHVEFERPSLFGRQRSTVTDPDPGLHRISIVGEAPESCRGGVGVGNRLVVNTEIDAIDDVPGDGVCSTGISVDDRPVCSLRAAVMEANATPGQDVIEVPNGNYRLTQQNRLISEGNPAMMATIGDLDITDGVSIYGDLDATNAEQLGVRIDGNTIDRVFHIHPMSTSDEDRVPYVHLEGMIITNGTAIRDGDAARLGGGILNLAQLRLTRVYIVGNVARDGAGIFNQGFLTADRTQIERNCVGASCYGGGIENIGHLTLVRSAIIGNVGRASGGGIFVLSRSPGDTVTRLINSTVAFNEGYAGSAISFGEAELTNTTIAFNVAFDGDGPMNVRRIKATNSLIVLNSDRSGPVSRDCNGRRRIGGVGGNVYDSDRCDFDTLLDNNRRITDGAFDSELVYDGFTLSLRPGAAYRDQGIEFNVFCLHEDQNSNARPMDGDGDGLTRCDPGAVEWSPP